MPEILKKLWCCTHLAGTDHAKMCPGYMGNGHLWREKCWFLQNWRLVRGQIAWLQQSTATLLLRDSWGQAKQCRIARLWGLSVSDHSPCHLSGWRQHRRCRAPGLNKEHEALQGSPGFPSVPPAPCLPQPNSSRTSSVGDGSVLPLAPSWHDICPVDVLHVKTSCIRSLTCCML